MALMAQNWKYPVKSQNNTYKNPFFGYKYTCFTEYNRVRPILEISLKHN